jgi:putative SOS response-associated peptidase YedK
VAWDANDSGGARVKRYDASRMIRFVATEEQKQWLLSQTQDMKSLSHVMRDLVNQAMRLHRDGILPATKR